MNRPVVNGALIGVGAHHEKGKREVVNVNIYKNNNNNNTDHGDVGIPVKITKLGWDHASEESIGGYERGFFGRGLFGVFFLEISQLDEDWILVEHESSSLV